MPKAWQREHHHHHSRLTALLVQYAHLNVEERLKALDRDVKELAEAVKDPGRAACVLDRIACRPRPPREVISSQPRKTSAHPQCSAYKLETVRR
jgi:hypothetical protein